MFTHTTAFRVEVRKNLIGVSGQNKARFVAQQLHSVSQLLTYPSTSLLRPPFYPCTSRCVFLVCIKGCYQREVCDIGRAKERAAKLNLIHSFICP